MVYTPIAHFFTLHCMMTFSLALFLNVHIGAGWYLGEAGSLHNGTLAVLAVL